MIWFISFMLLMTILSAMWEQTAIANKIHMKLLFRKIRKHENIDVYERDKAVLIVNDEIKEGNTHSQILGFESTVRQTIINEEAEIEKIAFLHLIDNYIVLDETDYSSIRGEELDTYSYEEIIELVKNTKKYKGLIQVFYHGGRNALEIDKVIQF